MRKRNRATGREKPLKSILAAIAAQAPEFHQRVSRSAVCVYGLDNRDEIEAVGTATLIQVGDARFAVSAKHLLERMREGELAIGAEALVAIGNQRWFSTTGSDDRFDLAFVRLTDEQVADMGDCLFIAPEEMDLSEKPDLTRPTGSKYYVLGYPWRMNDRRRNEPIKPHSLLISTLPASANAYSNHAVEMASHLLLELDRKNMSNRDGPTTSPKLHGMSGCGIWSAPRNLETPSGRERLLAILTEHHGGSDKVIVATRIGVFLDGVRRSYPELGRGP